MKSMSITKFLLKIPQPTRVLFFVIRALCHMAQPAISKKHAAECLRAQCLQHGWEWEKLQPLQVRELLTCYQIKTNIDCLGGNLTIRLDFQRGEILHVKVIPR